MNEPRNRRVMVNFTEDEYQRLMQEVTARRGRISLSSFIKDALDFYYAVRENYRTQPAHNSTAPEDTNEDAPVTRHNAPLRVLPNDKE